MCRSRRELSNEYLLAKFGFDTAENEPCEVCPIERSGPQYDQYARLVQDIAAGGKLGMQFGEPEKVYVPVLGVDAEGAALCFSNSELERIFSNFYFVFELLSNVSKIIF